LHPAPSAIGQLDPQLLVEVESELGLVQVYDLDSHKEYFQKTFQKLIDTSQDPAILGGSLKGSPGGIKVLPTSDIPPRELSKPAGAALAG